MRFITEFEFHFMHSVNDVESRRKHYNHLLGENIAESFFWQSPINDNKNHHRLEIEAFPMDKWIEFKHKILDMKLHYPSDYKLIEQYFHELESFGKPEQSKTIE